MTLSIHIGNDYELHQVYPPWQIALDLLYSFPLFLYAYTNGKNNLRIIRKPLIA